MRSESVFVMRAQRYNPQMKKHPTLLGGLTTAEFLRDYWQKRPLLIRQALPQFSGLLEPAQLMDLACDPDIEARLVAERRGRWQLQRSPFMQKDFGAQGKSGWTVLVQGVNHYLPEGAALLDLFNFIPHARLDDLMVSYAPRGGGVGPHFDDYDVFLLQGKGHRRWQISTQRDRSLIEDAPLKILRNFKVEHEWVLAPGDMLYLPPHCAHNGIAEDDCMTYSIGFRTPTHQELAEQFLVYLQDRIQVEGLYADPGLKAQRHPSEIGADMLQQVSQAIGRVKWGPRDIADFLGCYLSEPKPHVFFDPPARPLTQASFERSAARRGVAADLKSRMLCHAGTVFINGMACPVGRAAYKALRMLADVRVLNAAALRDAPEALDVLYPWYRDGYIHLME